MKIDFTTILFIGVIFFLAVWLGKLAVGRATSIRKNEDLDPVKTELHALNVKFNSLRNEFDVLKTEIIALKIKAQPAKHVQNSTTSILKDAHANAEDTWNRDARVSELPFASMMPPQSPFDDIWARDAVLKEPAEGDAMADGKKKSPRLGLKGSAINDNEIVTSSHSK